MTLCKASPLASGNYCPVMDEMAPLQTVAWRDGNVVLVDQTKLPGSLEYLELSDVAELVAAIKRLSVRGAPALGVAGAYGVALAVLQYNTDDSARAAAIDAVRTARPTAVNLGRMVSRCAELVPNGFERVLAEAHAIRDSELLASTAMGSHGADLVLELVDSPTVRGMTICNTGGLAAIERGTALAVVQTLHERGVLDVVLACETRPLLQGSRLTIWEAQRFGANAKLIVDSAGPALLARGEVDFVVAGADRIAANGDAANKIGTYSLALGARAAGVPFIIVAPESTVDLSLASGDEIEIEDRGAGEVAQFGDRPTSPPGTSALNPAFDVTPVGLITAIVTEQRVVRFADGQAFTSVPLGASITS